MLAQLSKRCFQSRLPYYGKISSSTQYTFPHRKSLLVSYFSSIPSPPYRIMLFGADVFSLQILKSLYSSPSNLVSSIEVVCPPDRKSKQSFLKKQAKAMNLIVHEVPHWMDFKMTDWEPKNGFDIGVVASFGYFIPPSQIESFQYGMVNIHPSLLPKYRGASPIQYALLNGDCETGVSLITVDPVTIDAGKILSQQKISIENDDTFESLRKKTANIGSELLISALNQYGILLDKSTTQSTELERISNTKKIIKKKGSIDWSNTSNEILRLWRGLHGFSPVFTSFNGKRVLILDMHDCDDPISKKNPFGPGHVRLNKRDGVLVVKCGPKGENTVAVRSIQLAQKRKQTPARHFANGYLQRKRLAKGEEYFFI